MPNQNQSVPGQATDMQLAESRKIYDKMNFWIRLALMIFTGITGWLLMFGVLYPGKSWQMATFLASLYVFAIEGVIAANIYGLKKVFSTFREIAIGYAVMSFLLGVIILNVLSEFRHTVLGHEINPGLVYWQTWGLFLVPVVGLVQSIAMVLIAPLVRQNRLNLRDKGKRQEWQWEARSEAYETDAVLGAKNIIAEFEGTRLALQALAMQLQEMPEAMKPAFVEKVREKFGDAAVVAIGGESYLDTPAIASQASSGSRSGPQRVNGRTQYPNQ